jgi:hypothetical protein
MMLIHAAMLLAAQNAAMAVPPRVPAPPAPRHAGREIRMEGAREPLSAVKAAVRAEAQRLYGRDCGRVSIPDRAFVPLEITGANNPEYAVLLGRATCAIAAQLWEGTGGAMVQFWYASDGAPRMLMERMIRGFTPTGAGVDLLQHGTYCPGGAGPNVCLVEYRWHEKDRALYPVRRTFIDGKHGRVWPKMQWQDQQIWQ